MRLIVRHRPSLHVWNVNDYIKQTQANIIKQDSNKYLTLQKIFRKVYLRHLKDHQRVKYHQNNLDNFVLLSQAPARAIADYFHQKSKEYSEPFLRITFEALARAYVISKQDNNGSLDTLGYKLFYSSQFCNLSEELKYALRNNKLEFDSVASILDSLIKLEYIDYEIVNLLLLYTKREMDGKHPYSMLTHWHGDREFQIEKSNYYNPRELDDLRSLRASEEVITAISFVRHIYQEWERSQEMAQTLRTHNIQELNALVEGITETNQNFRKLVEGIINVRKQYLQMVEFSQTEEVLRNPNLNFELLELEEKLMATKLITIDDIKNPKDIANSETEVARVEEIILRVLDVHRLDPVFTFIDKSAVEVVNEKEEFKPDSAKLSLLLNGLAKLAQIDRYVYHAQDGKNLVSLKWEKTLVPQLESRSLPTSLQEELNVSRIYRRVYQEILKFVTSNGKKLEGIFKDSNLSHRVEFIDAYCRIGLNENAIAQFSSLHANSLPSALSELPSSKFASLVHVLNDVGIFITNETLHASAFDRIVQELQKEEENIATYNIRFTIDVANYLLQNHRTHHQFRSVYERILKLLEAKATYVTLDSKENEAIVEAFKILALEKPEQFGSHPIYLHFLHRTVNDEYKRNPFQSILRETVFKWAGKESSLKHLQNYLTVGVSSGIQNGVIFSNSDETSIDGEIRSGDLNSYIVRLELKNGVKINELSISSMLQVNYASPSKIFKLRPLEQLKERLNEIFEYQQQEFDQIYITLQTNLLQIFKFYRPSVVSDRIRFKLIVLNRLRVSSGSVSTREQEYSNKAKFLLEVLELNKLIMLLSEGNIYETMPLPEPTNAPINDQLQKENFQREEKDVLEVDVETIRMLLREVKSVVPELLDSISNYMKQETLTIEKSLQPTPYLNGERQSIEVLQGESSGKLDLTYEFINLRYYNDKTYCEYGDWKERISQKYQYTEINYENVGNLTKILANKLCGDVTNKLNLLPICKHEDRLQRLSLEFQVFSHENPPAAVPAKSVDREVEYIINLQNFKHELKTFSSPKKIVDYIFGFKFINELHHRSPEKETLVLTRNAEEYFNYLEELNDKSYLESPYAKYIISKLGKSDRIRFLLEERKILRVNLRILYQKGLIDGSEYYAKVNEFEDQIIEALGELKSKMLDHMEDSLLDGEFKMIDIRKEELEAFEDIVNKQFGYSRHFDEDFICAHGNYDRALHLKRGRAQNNYIKLYLLKKLSENQLLDNREKALLKRWHEDITRSVSEFVVYPEFTTLQIADLSWEDMQLLKLKHSQLNVNKDMLLIDLILEFNHFLDESLIHNYEREVKAEFVHKYFKIPAYLFDKTNNTSFKRLEVETEAAIANEHSRLTEQDLDKVEELFKVYKTQGFRERNRYSVFCKNFRSNINEMNEQIIRNELIEEYIRHLESEFYKEYNPALVSDIKEKETDKLWRSVFQQTYDSCNKELLKDITKKLILRLEAIGENPPPFFGNMLFKLLLHPNLDSHSRESLIAAVEINQFDLNLDSADIEVISKLKGKTVRSSLETRADLKTISSVKISKYLREKAQAVL